MTQQIISQFTKHRKYWRAFPALLALAAFAQNDPAPVANRPTLARPQNAALQNDVPPAPPPWKSKQIPEWTETDAKQVITDSPWVKTFTPTLAPASAGQQPSGRGRPRVGMGGIGIGGVGVGLPGMGRRMGGGYPQGGGNSRRGGSPGRQSDDRSSNELPGVMLRWESAMPIRTAELVAHDENSPIIDDKHYAIAVYGVPGQYLTGDAKKLEADLKKDATLRRDGKKDVKPSRVSVVEKPDGPVVVYEFSTSNEITKDDHRVEFNAKLGRLELIQSFFLDDMVWQGKREL